MGLLWREQERNQVRHLLDSRRWAKRVSIQAKCFPSSTNSTFKIQQAECSCEINFFKRAAEQATGCRFDQSGWRGDSRYDRTFVKPWNNARFNTVAIYYDLVPGFERLLEAKRGDLKAFYAAVEAMRTMTQTERRAVLGRD